MTNKVQKIREKVVEIINSINPFIPDEDGKNSDYEAGKLDAATQILQIIDSLQEEPVSRDYRERYKNIAQSDAFKSAYENKSLGEVMSVEGEEPVSEELEEAALMHFKDVMEYEAKTGLKMANITSFKAGAKWQAEQFEKNRLKHCNSITNEQAELEQGFIDQHLDKHQRMPTFLDAIEYGIRLQKEQMMAKAIRGRVNVSIKSNYHSLIYGCWDMNDALKNCNEGDKVKVIVIKE